MRTGAKQAAGTCDKSWVKEVQKRAIKQKNNTKIKKNHQFKNMHLNVSGIFTLYSFLTGTM